ncbi:MAG: hypothetical protein ACI9B9_001536 [Halioglobus sp.]|jgi:hypothetical protein
MRSIIVLSALALFFSLNSMAFESESSHSDSDLEENVTASKVDVERIWMNYTDSKGGITWGESTDYPEYQKVKEGDNVMIQLEQGPCLMEFFHGRWRRANDVRRWDESVNAYGGCPYVFE